MGRTKTVRYVEGERRSVRDLETGSRSENRRRSEERRCRGRGHDPSRDEKTDVRRDVGDGRWVRREIVPYRNRDDSADDGPSLMEWVLDDDSTHKADLKEGIHEPTTVVESGKPATTSTIVSSGLKPRSSGFKRKKVAAVN